MSSFIVHNNTVVNGNCIVYDDIVIIWSALE